MYKVPRTITSRVRVGSSSWSNLRPWPNGAWPTTMANGERYWWRRWGWQECHLRWWHLFTHCVELFSSSFSSPKERSTGTSVVMPSAPPTGGGLAPSGSTAGISTPYMDPIVLTEWLQALRMEISASLELLPSTQYFALCPSTATGLALMSHLRHSISLYMPSYLIHYSPRFPSFWKRKFGLSHFSFLSLFL